MRQRTGGTVVQEWDRDLSEFIKLVLSRHGVKTRSAAEVGKRAVTYFRGSEFCKFVLKNGDHIRKKTPNVCEGLDLTDPKDCVRLGDRLIRKRFIYRAQHKPFTQASGDESRSNDQKVPKWPKRLIAVSPQTFDENDFYIVAYEGSKTWSYVLLGLIILSVLLMCLFPVWPLSMKIGIWYISVFLMLTLFALIVGRLVVFLLFWFGGVDFWILPNLFDEKAGLVESFMPLYSWELRKDDWKMVLVRIFCCILTGVAVYQLNQVHSIDDMRDFAKTSVNDLLDWGRQKLVAGPQTTQRQYPSLEDIEKANSDEIQEQHVPFRCLEKCGFETPEAVQDECMTDCACMKELVGTTCFRQCDDEEKEKLNDALKGVCAVEASVEAEVQAAAMREDL